MITKDQAMKCQDFHYNGCTRRIGPRGGVTEKTESWRRNGVTKVWKTRPDEFRVPLKYGLKAYGELTHLNASEFHVEGDCPLEHSEGEVG